MLIGILQCGHAADAVRAIHGDFDAMFAQLLSGHGFEFKTWNVVDGEFPVTLNQADGWLLSGSKHGAYEDHAFIRPLESFVCDIYTSERAMVGVCFGHQIIAQALGGRVEKFSGGWAIGQRSYDYAGRGDVRINAWHQDQVVKRPQDAQVIAHSDFCENAALVYGRKAYTIQPHPEFDNIIIRDYVWAKRTEGIFPADQLRSAAEMSHTAINSDQIAMDMADFFKGSYTA